MDCLIDDLKNFEIDCSLYRKSLGSVRRVPFGGAEKSSGDCSFVPKQPGVETSEVLYSCGCRVTVQQEVDIVCAKHSAPMKEYARRTVFF